MSANLYAPASLEQPHNVREYLTYILRAHSIPSKDCEEISARWQFGRGQELHSYDRTTIQQILGPEAGWIIYDVVSQQSPQVQASLGRTGNREPLISVGKSDTVTQHVVNQLTKTKRCSYTPLFFCSCISATASGLMTSGRRTMNDKSCCLAPVSSSVA